MKTVQALLMVVLYAFAAAAFADEAGVRRAVEAQLGVKVDEVQRSGYGALYEVRVGDEIIYTDEKVSYLLVGALIDPKTRQNVTEARKEKLATIRFDQLPLQSAIKTVRGNGKATLAVFADPNCSFCKRMERELAVIARTTVARLARGAEPGDVAEDVGSLASAHVAIFDTDGELLGETPATFRILPGVLPVRR